MCVKINLQVCKLQNLQLPLFSSTGRDQPLGQYMLELFEHKRSDWTPLLLKMEDNMQILALKRLMSNMIAYHPAERLGMARIRKGIEEVAAIGNFLG